MAKKLLTFKTKGMNRDLSVSAFNPEFSFENLNLRLSTNEGNTLMSWVNEKGTQRLDLSISTREWEEEPVVSSTIVGTPIGTAVINHLLVLFTSDPSQKYNADPSPDYIYVFKLSDTEEVLNGRLLYNGNLNFNIEYPIETLVSYESETVQKVYWTDGYNLPRVINIAADIDKIKKWNSTVAVGATKPTDTFFDFVPALKCKEEVTIEKVNSSGGVFAPGVIQYCLSYVNIYGQQSNIFYVSPLYYLAHNDRGASPDEKVTASFTIEINNVDQRFDYLRIYSIQRTSLNDTPIVKLLDTLATTSSTLKYTDAGNTGAAMDPTELLFIGGKEITALTMSSKDLTLFLGNIEEKNVDISSIQEYFDALREVDDLTSMGIEYKNDGLLNKFTLDGAFGVYSHTNTLNYNRLDITTFKGGETYRFGFLLQKITGEWSEPIFLNDVENPYYPNTNVFRDGIYLVYAQADINFNDIAVAGNLPRDFYSVYLKIRPVIVFPTIGDRHILCLGVINPTLFNAKDRLTNSPFAQASWYFRPYMLNDTSASWDNETESALNVSPIQSVNKVSRAGQTLATGDYDCWVLVASCTLDTYDEIVSRGYIEVSEDYHPGGTTSRTIKHIVYVRGTIDLNETFEGRHFYAFVSNTKFPGIEVGNSPQMIFSNDIDEYYYKGLQNLRADKNPTEISQYLEYKRDEKTYRFLAPEEEGSTYTFEFFAGDYKYSVIFNRVDTDYQKYNLTGTDKGNAVEYLHYKSLSTAEGISTAADKLAILKKLEILGAVKQYNDGDTDNRAGWGLTLVFTLTGISDSNKASNSQFLVDLSIITLNSPDIEFDTEVLAFGTDGMHLRIIGAIPITANASFHQIQSSNTITIIPNSQNPVPTHGNGELDTNVIFSNISPFAGKRLVADKFWNDGYISAYTTSSEGENGSKREATSSIKNNFMVYPWLRTGSLNNDTRNSEEANSILKTKKESNILYSLNSVYLPEEKQLEYTNIGMLVILTENAEVMNYRLHRQLPKSADINYYPNIDKVIFYGGDGYNDYSFATSGNTSNALVYNTPISLKYLTTSHAAISMVAGEEGKIPVMPKVRIKGDPSLDNNAANFRGAIIAPNVETYWDSGYEGDPISFTQSEIVIEDLFKNDNNTVLPLNLLWLGEIYKDVPVPFGGKTKEALRSNSWLVGGKEVPLGTKVTLTWTQGDTYYQRYDCLKTYAMTHEDHNLIVEILSFMCETHTNIDGRYDRNRGQIDNTNMSPLNFNLLNPVYTQQDNFFLSKKTLIDLHNSYTYPNHVAWSLTKQSGADVDLWTNVALGSTLELDGDKGKISKLIKFNDSLIAFQDTGISLILYNENVQIASTTGVPIEIANSGKVQGKKYISETIGCSNKWSVCQTPFGVYFIDSHDKSINVFNGLLLNLSVSAGFDSWSKNNILVTERGWTPKFFEDFTTLYDKNNKDVLFINNDIALAYSERVNAFTSFYNYNGIPYLCNLDGRGLWIKDNSYSANNPPYGRVVHGVSSIYGHLEGAYCNFFGDDYSYSMTLVGNPEPLLDKVFTNLEFRANVDYEGTTESSFVPYLPFDNLEVWNEYQHGYASLKNQTGHSAMVHHAASGESALKKKFRIWRCDIPRDNYPLIEGRDVDTEKGIYRYSRRPVDRMRNPWVYLKLQKDEDTNKRVEVHDITMTYFQ